jgi:hypothetical protein
MVTDVARCAHCDSPIVNPVSSERHGSQVFCCRNCAHEMEQGGSGTDPQAGRWENELTCAHCGCHIVDESSMQTQGDQAFCCDNCARAMATTTGR